MIKCQSCGTENLDGAQFCDECGANLQISAGSNNEINVQNFQPLLSEPSFNVASVTSIGIEPIIEQVAPVPVEKPSERKSEGAHSMLVIERGTSVGKRFNLSADESYIGRWDADNGIFPDVDLDAYDPEAKVSRRHARIRRENGNKYIIEDLGSTNGTFINRGRRLIPGNSNILNDGDEIIVGKTFLRFYIND